mmetsp:Transcript_19546/g.25313  ORF Transcript_19546/g.25313 Transcript_19546/m.25313 type:complete len:149 (-) Transcript_19546:96-542(-)
MLQKANQGTKRQRRKYLPRTHRSLAVLLESVRDERLCFELKNETTLSGLLFDVDSNLNVNLVDAVLQNLDGTKFRLDETYVNGSMIRYVRFPDKIDPMRSLDHYLDTRARISRAGMRTKRPCSSSFNNRPIPPPPIQLSVQPGGGVPP